MTAAVKQQVDTFISLTLIDESPLNPRKVFDDLAELKVSLKEKGQLMPLLVRPVKGGRYELADGARRRRALLANGEATALCMVRDLSDRDIVEIGLISLLQKKDISAIEEAGALKALTTNLKVPVKEVAARVGKSESYVQQRIKLTELCEDARKALAEGRLFVATALQMVHLTDEQQGEVLKRVAAGFPKWDGATELREEPMPVAQAQREILLLLRRLRNAVFDTKSAELVQIAGSCSLCPKSTGTQTEMFGTVTEDDARCTDAKCWDSKVAAHRTAVIAKLKAEGKKVLEDDKVWALGGHALKDSVNFVDLDHSVWTGKDNVKWREVVDGAGLEVTRAVDLHGKVHELVNKSKAEGSLETYKRGARSKAKSSSSSKGTKTESKKSEAELIEEAQERALLDAIVAKAEKASPAALLRIVAKDWLNAGNVNEELIAERRGIRDAHVEFEKLIDKADVTKLQGIVAEFMASERFGLRNDVIDALKVDVDVIEKKAEEMFKKAQAPAAPAKPEEKKPAAKKAKATKKKGGKR